MFLLSGLLGLVGYFVQGTVMSGVLHAIVGAGLTSIVWGICESETLFANLDTRSEILLSYLFTFLVGAGLTLWMTTGLGFPLVESALTVGISVVLSYYFIFSAAPFTNAE